MKLNLLKLWLILFGCITFVVIFNIDYDNSYDNNNMYINMNNENRNEFYKEINNVKKNDLLCLIDENIYSFCDEIFNVIFYEMKEENKNNKRVIDVLEYKDIYENMENHKIDINDNIDIEYINPTKEKLKYFLKNLKGKNVLLVSISKIVNPYILLETRKHNIKLYIMHIEKDNNYDLRFITNGIIEMDNNIDGINLFYVAEGKLKNFEKVNNVKLDYVFTLNDGDKELVSYMASNNKLKEIII